MHFLFQTISKGKSLDWAETFAKTETDDHKQLMKNRKLLSTLNLQDKRIQFDINRVGFIEEGKHSIPIMERARRVYGLSGAGVLDLEEVREQEAMLAQTQIKKKEGTGAKEGDNEMKHTSSSPDSKIVPLSALEASIATTQSGIHHTQATTNNNGDANDSANYKAFLNSMIELTQSTTVNNITNESATIDISIDKGSGKKVDFESKDAKDDDNVSIHSHASAEHIHKSIKQAITNVVDKVSLSKNMELSIVEEIGLSGTKIDQMFAFETPGLNEMAPIYELKPATIKTEGKSLRSESKDIQYNDDIPVSESKTQINYELTSELKQM
jgi:hypothetical protein